MAVAVNPRELFVLAAECFRRKLTAWAQRLSSTAVYPPSPPTPLNRQTPGEPGTADTLLYIIYENQTALPAVVCADACFPVPDCASAGLQSAPGGNSVFFQFFSAVIMSPLLLLLVMFDPDGDRLPKWIQFVSVPLNSLVWGIGLLLLVYVIKRWRRSQAHG